MRTNETLLKMYNEGNFAVLGEYLKENIREETAKKAGATQSDITIIKRIVKDAGDNGRMNGALPFKFDGKDLIGFCDGHRILASKSDFGYKEIENPVDLSACMREMENHKFEQFGAKIEIDRGKVKEAKARNKGRKQLLPFIINTPYAKIGCNPSLLLDTLDFVGSNIIYTADTAYRDIFYKHPLYCVNEEKERYSELLPVNIQYIAQYLSEEEKRDVVVQDAVI